MGTDHGWGGNTFVLGGSVKGGRILGDYPSNFTAGPINVSNSVLLPTLPWEALWNAVSLWLGFAENSLNQVLPNRPNFLNGNYLLGIDKLFG